MAKLPISLSHTYTHTRTEFCTLQSRRERRTGEVPVGGGEVPVDSGEIPVGGGEVIVDSGGIPVGGERLMMHVTDMLVVSAQIASAVPTTAHTRTHTPQMPLSRQKDDSAWHQERSTTKRAIA